MLFWENMHRIKSDKDGQQKEEKSMSIIFMTDIKPLSTLNVPVSNPFTTELRHLQEGLVLSIRILTAKKLNFDGRSDHHD